MADQSKPPAETVISWYTRETATLNRELVELQAQRRAIRREILNLMTGRTRILTP